MSRAGARIMVLTTLGLGLVGGGCGSSDAAPAAPARAPVSQEQFPDALAASICSCVARCCTDWGFAFDKTACTAGVRSDGKAQVDRGTAATGVTWDPELARTCVELYQELSLSCTFSDERLLALKASCDHVWKGTRQQGEACGNDFECAGHVDGTARCWEAPGADAGTQRTCGPASGPAHAAEGEACSQSCRLTSQSWQCEPVAGQGVGLCWDEDGLVCEPATGKCTAQGSVGQPCDAMTNCVQSAWCDDGTCAARIAAAGACELAGTSDPCEEGTWCNGSACEAGRADGAQCTSFRECASQQCRAGKCLPRNIVASEHVCNGG